MISLDTSVLLRFLLEDVPEQTVAAARIVEARRVYITDVVAVEAVYVMEKVYTLDRQDIVALLLQFLGLPHVVYNKYFLKEVLDMYGIHAVLSIVDCYAAVEARIYQNRLATFDKRLAHRGGSHVSLL